MVASPRRRTALVATMLAVVLLACSDSRQGSNIIWESYGGPLHAVQGTRIESVTKQTHHWRARLRLNTSVSRAAEDFVVELMSLGHSPWIDLTPLSTETYQEFLRCRTKDRCSIVGGHGGDIDTVQIHLERGRADRPGVVRIDRTSGHALGGGRWRDFPMEDPAQVSVVRAFRAARIRYLRDGKFTSSTFLSPRREENGVRFLKDRPSLDFDEVSVRVVSANEVRLSSLGESGCYGIRYVERSRDPYAVVLTARTHPARRCATDDVKDADFWNDSWD